MYKFLMILIPALITANPLETAYDTILHVKDNRVFFKDGTTLPYDDKETKDILEKIKNPDIEDMLYLKYNRNIKTRNDAGRIRNEELFKKLYGENRKEIEKNLTTIIWLPNHKAKKILFNRNEKAAYNLQLISNELDKLPKKYMKYITNISGTYVYRYITKTNRLSTHSFGIAIDINIKFANYWKWDKKLSYKNRIPKEIVEIFEKHHFIWGGRWYHYDTIHFEYRPELN